MCVYVDNIIQTCRILEWKLVFVHYVYSLYFITNKNAATYKVLMHQSTSWILDTKKKTQLHM